VSEADENCGLAPPNSVSEAARLSAQLERLVQTADFVSVADNCPPH